MSIGQQLEKARKAQSFSIEDVAQATHIRTHYLEALEADNLEIFPSMVQVRGFLRAYARYLDLDVEGMLVELDGVPQETSPPIQLQTSQPPAVSLKEPDMEQADAILSEVGSKLRNHRDILGLSLEDVERQTHIRVHYLAALESGDLNGLPSPVQGRGMLNNYATFLGLDPDPLLLRYADGLQAQLAAKRSVQREQNIQTSHQPVSRPSLLRRIFSTDFIVGSILVVFLIAFIAWGALRISAMRAEGDPTPTSPSIAQVLLNSATETVESTPSGPALNETASNGTGVGTTVQETISPTDGAVGVDLPTETAVITLPVVGEGPLQLSAVIQQRAWMRVVVDEETQFEGRVQAGGAYSFSGEQRIELLTGNGAAIKLYFNQEELGTIGLFGEVVHWVFTVEGLQTPTATLTPTGLPTPTSSPTPPGGPANTPTPGP